MSVATLTPSPGDHDDHGLSEFLAAVPAAADFDREDLFEGRPRRPHRPARPTEKRRAIKSSLTNGPYRTTEREV